MRWLFICLVSTITLSQGIAQSGNRGEIRGIAVDSTTRQPLMLANVSLLQAKDSSFITFTVTGGEGNFIFRNLPEGHYRVLVTFMGYRNASVKLSVTNDKPQVDLGILEMAQAPLSLDEVVISQERTPVELKGDTLEFDAGSFRTRENAQVEELLKKLPGIEISRDGTIRAQGEEVKRVLVDGKPFFGDDPKVATRNLPADIIDRIQLYDQQSDQAAFSGFDDGTREKTINLTTKKDKRKGVFGRNSLGIGSDNRYQGQLSLNRFNNGRQISLIGMGNNVNQQEFTMQDMLGFGSGMAGGMNANAPGGFGGPGGGGPILIGSGRGGNSSGNGSGSGTATSITETWAGGLNFRDQWGKNLDVNGSYFFNNAGVTTDQTSRRQTILPDTVFTSEGENRSHNDSQNHRLNFRIDYRIDSLNSIRIIPAISLQNSQYTSLSDSRTFSGNGSPLNRSTVDNLSTGEGIQGTNTLLYMHKFRRHGRTFSFNLNTVLADQHTLATNTSSNIFYGDDNGLPTVRPINQQNDQQTNVFNNTATLSYTEPLSLRRILEAHYIFGRNTNRSSRRVNDYNETSSQYDQVNEALSNQFDNSFTTQQGGLALQTRRLKYTYSIGADLQIADLRTDNQSSDRSLSRRFTNMLPNALFTYNVSSNRTLRINYRTRMNAPTVSQLQPVADNTNPLNIRLGNPNLQPEYIHNLLATYNTFHPSTFRSLFAVLNISRTDNKIVNATTIAHTGAQTTQPINQNGYYTANGFMVLGRRIRPIKSNLNLTTNLTYSRGVSLVNDQPNRSQSLLLGQGVSLHSNISEKLEFNVSATINYQQAHYSLMSQQNTEFFNKTLALDLYYQLPFRLIITSDLSYTNHSGRSAGYNQNFVLWNVGLTRQVFKNKQGEIKVYIYDLLDQNRSIVRNVGDTYVEDIQSQVLSHYVMLSFTYHLRKFGGNNGKPGIFNSTPFTRPLQR